MILFDADRIVRDYCSYVAKLKETEREGPNNEIVATYIFGAQQLLWLFWSESRSGVDPFRANILLMHSVLKDANLPKEMRAFVDEFNENVTAEAKFAHLCGDLEDLLQSVNPECTGALIEFLEENYPEFPISLEELKSVISHYNVLCVLKHKTRRGWECWNVNVPRREVVSEHVFGTEPLALLIDLAIQGHLNMPKVIAMMSLHETEESIMEDYVPYDPVTPEQMLAEGKVAVAQALGGLNQYKLFESLIDEFNARQTPEAKFAHLCDKLECNFRAKLYSDFGLCPIENGQKDAIADPEVQENLKKGAKSVSDLFLMHIMHEYVGTPFEEIANCLRNYDTTQI